MPLNRHFKNDLLAFSSMPAENCHSIRKQKSVTIIFNEYTALFGTFSRAYSPALTEVVFGHPITFLTLLSIFLHMIMFKIKPTHDIIFSQLFRFFKSVFKTSFNNNDYIVHLDFSAAGTKSNETKSLYAMYIKIVFGYLTSHYNQHYFHYPLLILQHIIV